MFKTMFCYPYSVSRKINCEHRFLASIYHTFIDHPPTMYLSSWLLLLCILLVVNALRIQPGARWLQRISLKHPSLIETPLAGNGPVSTLHTSNSRTLKVTVPYDNKFSASELSMERQSALPETNVIDMFKARRPYAIWNSTLVRILCYA